MNRFSLAAIAILGLAAPVVQAATSWNFTSGTNCSDGSIGGAGNCAWGNTRSTTVNGVTATAQAWSNTKGSATTQLETGYLAVYGNSGLGVKNRDGAYGATPADSNEYSPPEHSVDSNGRYDSILFSFSQAITLTSVRAGWYETDSDITIMAYTGAGTPVLDGKSFANLLSGGWTAIGNYADIGTSTAGVNAGEVSSSYWLIGAYNPNILNSGWSQNNDYLKIVQLSGNPTPPRDQGVPEPASLALVGLALAGLMVRRKG